MKTTKVGANIVREPTQQITKAAARKSRVSFGRNMVQEFSNTSSDREQSTIVERSTLAERSTLVEREPTLSLRTESEPVPVPTFAEDDKENDLDLTGCMFAETRKKRNSFDFSFEMTGNNSPALQSSGQTRNLFTETINLGSNEKTKEVTESVQFHADDSLGILPPITPEPKKKRRSLLQTIQQNNFIRQNSPQVSRQITNIPANSISTGPKVAENISKQNQAITSASKTNLNASMVRKQKFLRGVFDCESSDESESDEEMEKENKTVFEPFSNETVDFDNTLGGEKTMNFDRTLAMEKTMDFDRTLAMEKTMNIDETISAGTENLNLAKLREKMRAHSISNSSNLPKPKSSNEIVPELVSESPVFRSPLQITDNDIAVMNVHLSKLQDDEPCTPSTPNRKKTKIRGNLVRARESIGLALNRLNSPIRRTPTTRRQTKLDEISSSPVTRSVSRKMTELDPRMEDSPLKPPITPKTPKVQMVSQVEQNNPSPLVSARKKIQRNNSITGFELKSTDPMDLSMGKLIDTMHFLIVHL